MLASGDDITSILAKRALDPSITDSLIRDGIAQLHRQQESINGAAEILDESYQLHASQAQQDNGLLLSGIPFSVKETIGLQGHDITAGSITMQPQHCADDSTVVRKLRVNGAVPIARSNIPEFAMCYDSENLRYGRTNNPLNHQFSAGGSSGGEAALVASGATLFGIGSDIGGSIRYPAHCCGVVGFKPESKAVNKEGTFPQLNGSFCDSMLALGPLTRSVRDARLIYELIANHKIIEQTRHRVRLIKPTDFQLKVESASIDSAWQSAENALLAAGYHPENKLGVDVRSLYQDYLKLITAEFEPLMRSALADQDGQPFSPAKELFNQLRGSAQVHPYVYWPLLLMPLIKPSAEQYQQSQRRVEEARLTVRQLLGKDGVLLLPTNGALAMKHGKASWKINRPWMQKAFTPTIMMNVLDLPSISVPAKRFQNPLSGLIPGLMIAVAPGAEDLLFSAAQLIEKSFRLSVADH